MKKYILFSLLIVGLTAQANIIDNAKSLIKNGQFNEAYQLLITKEQENIDNSDYNYQLGVAALRSGQHSAALYALDRVLSENPNHIGAQLDMAIAYFHIGNLEFAEQEFNKILTNHKDEAPKIVISTINNYLEKIKKKNQKTTSTIIGSISTGYSNNINSGIDGNSVYVPLLNTTSTYSQKISDSFVNAQVIMNNNTKIDRNNSANLAIVVNSKKYSSNKVYDQENVIAIVNGTNTNGLDSYSYGLTGLKSYLNGNGYYKMVSANIGAKHTPSKSTSYGIKIKKDKTRFIATSNEVNDSNKTTLSVDYSNLIADNKVGMSIALNTGKTDVLSSSNANGNNAFTGMSATFRKAINGGILSTNITYQQDRYKKTNSSFLVKRKDKISSASIKFLKPIEKNLTLDLGLSYRDQNSNIAIFDNDKLEASVGIKRTF